MQRKQIWGRTQNQLPKRCVPLVFRIPDDGQSPKTQKFWVLYTIVRTVSNINVMLFRSLTAMLWRRIGDTNVKIDGFWASTLERGERSASCTSQLIHRSKNSRYKLCASLDRHRREFELSNEWKTFFPYQETNTPCPTRLTERVVLTAP
jgi:hypothetical protein